MAQPFKLKAPTSGIVGDNDRVTYLITERLLVAAAGVFLVALLLAAELRQTPEHRMDLLETTTYVAP
jgi:hypothetical protein